MKKILIFVVCCFAIVFCFKSYSGSSGGSREAEQDAMLSYLPG